jgi:hypothetical protein
VSTSGQTRPPRVEGDGWPIAPAIASYSTGMQAPRGRRAALALIVVVVAIAVAAVASQRERLIRLVSFD